MIRNLRRVYRYIPSQKWDSESILFYILPYETKIYNYSEGVENTDFTY